MTNELWITFPDNFDELVDKYKQALVGSSMPTPSAVTYDVNSAQLWMGKHSIQVPIGTNQSVVCEALFELPLGEWLKDIDVRHKYDSESETSLYDAVRALNRRAKEEWGLEDLFQFEKLRVRIRKERLTQTRSD